MTLSEISIAFNNCNSSSNKSFKEYIKELELNQSDLETNYEVFDAYNYILGDVEKLIDKTILNVCASNMLLKKGYFNWGFVTSYYANFFIIQALNRLMLNFTTFNNKMINCSTNNYSNNSLKLKIANKSKGSHESQFQTFYDNYSHFKNQKSINREWNIGIRSFKLKPEAYLRNIINYHIEKNIFYELDIDLTTFNKIIVDNKKYKFDSKKTKINKPTNYSIHKLELALSRLSMAMYILNYIANDNSEYKNYFIVKNKKRLKNIIEKYPDIDDIIKNKLIEWLRFEEIETEQSVNI